VLTPDLVVIAALASTVLLLAIGARRNSIAPETARLLADAALLTPVLFPWR